VARAPNPTADGRALSERALYVYGVVPQTTPAELFEEVPGVDPSERVMLVNEGELGAGASGVSLDEFGEGPIESNLRDPSWLAEKARAHDRVLATAVGRTTIVPFRFGAIYRSEEQIRDLLRERTDLSATLGRLEGAVEFGVKAFVDRAVLRARLAAVGGPAGEPASTGRAYMQRRQLERRLDEDLARFEADCAHDSHERLSASAQEGRTNTLQQPEGEDESRQMILNGAYLVRTDADRGFREALSALERTYADDGVQFDLTGPWPPYNFVADEERS